MKRSGFTLIEILVTVSVLSVAIVTLFRAFTACLAATRFSRNLSLACYAADNAAWNLRAEAAEGSEGDFSWRYEVTPAQPAGVAELKFTVSWQEGIREKPYVLEICLLIPPLQNPLENPPDLP